MFNYYKDIDVKSIIDAKLAKYDLKKNGTIDAKFIEHLYNDCLAQMRCQQKVDIQAVKQALYSIQTCSSGCVCKEQLYAAFKMMIYQQEIEIPEHQEVSSCRQEKMAENRNAKILI